MKYLMVKTENGKKVAEETVDQAYVDKYTAPETLNWFHSIGGIETLRRRDNGTVIVTSVRPDKAVTKIAVFVPIKEA